MSCRSRTVSPFHCRSVRSSTCAFDFSSDVPFGLRHDGRRAVDWAVMVSELGTAVGRERAERFFQRSRGSIERRVSAQKNLRRAFVSGTIDLGHLIDPLTVNRRGQDPHRIFDNDLYFR